MPPKQNSIYPNHKTKRQIQKRKRVPGRKKAKKNNKDIVKLKICRAKGTVDLMKRQPTEWDKIFASCTSDRGVIPRACKKTKKEKPKQEIKPGQHIG